jgi:hypothetical protein
LKFYIICLALALSTLGCIESKNSDISKNVEVITTLQKTTSTTLEKPTSTTEQNIPTTTRKKQITSTTLGTTSTTLVTSTTILAPITAKNLAECGELSDFEDYEWVHVNLDSCTTRLLDSITNTQKCQSSLPQVEKRLCIFRLAVREGDTGFCTVFKNPAHKNTCINYVKEYG